MVLFRIIIHGLALSAANIFSIIVALEVYKMINTPHRLLVQLPLAVAISIVIFLFWMLLVKIPLLKSISVKTPKELSWIFLASLALGPVLFIPMHHATQGYFTGAGNIIALFQFQLPLNLLVILVAKRVINPISK